MNVSMDDLLGIIGAKEVHIFQLSQEIQRLKADLDKLQKLFEPKPETPALTNLLPFAPGVSHEQPVK